MNRDSVAIWRKTKQRRPFKRRAPDEVTSISTGAQTGAKREVASQLLSTKLASSQSASNPGMGLIVHCEGLARLQGSLASSNMN